MSKKSHRRQTKPAAVQSYLVSDALGDVLARALTAFDRADAYTLQRTLNGPQAGVELARLPNLRMFLESCVRLIDLSAQNGGRAPAHAAKKMRKALGLALSEGLPSAAFEVVTRRIAIIDKSCAAALRGLNGELEDLLAGSQEDFFEFLVGFRLQISRCQPVVQEDSIIFARRSGRH